MVSSFNFLGIVLDQSLSWKKHASMVTNKISKTLGILYRLKDIFPENILLTISKPYCLPYELWVIGMGN